MFVGTKGLVYDILSLECLTDDVLSFKVGDLSRYALSLD